MPVGFRVVLLLALLSLPLAWWATHRHGGEVARIELGAAEASPSSELPRAGTGQLRISTRPGASYLVRLIHWGTWQDPLTFLIQGGAATEITVPAGIYRLKFATVPHWHGDLDLFDPATEFYLLDRPLDFQAQPARQEVHLSGRPSPEALDQTLPILRSDF